MGSQLSVRRAPVELIVKVLLDLNVEDILSVSRVNRWLRDTVRKSARIQYRLCLDEEGCVECGSDVCQSLPASHKTNALKRQRDIWLDCSFVASSSNLAVRQTDLVSKPSDYARYFTQGIYIFHDIGFHNLDEVDSHVLYFLTVDASIPQGLCAMPETESRRNTAKLQRYGVAECDSAIRGFAIDRFEQDLVAMVTVEDEEPGGFSIFLHLRKLSGFNGRLGAHPQALRSDFPIVRIVPAKGDTIALRRERASIQIVGRNILVLMYTDAGYDDADASYNRLILVDWIDGEILAHDYTYNGVWTSYTFLSQDIFLLANCRSGTIDVVQLPIPSGDGAKSERTVIDATETFAGFKMLLRLQLPTRAQPIPNEIFSFYISAQPGPVPAFHGPCQDHSKHTPYFTSPNDGLIHVHVAIDDGTMRQDALRSDFVVHRRALLSLVTNHADAVTPGPLCTMTKKRRRRGRALKSNQPPPCSKVLEWKNWSPNVTHFFAQETPGGCSNRVVYGQRLVWIDKPAEEIVVWDFNPHSVRRAQKAVEGEDGANGGWETETSVVSSFLTPKKATETRIARRFGYSTRSMDIRKDATSGKLFSLSAYPLDRDDTEPRRKSDECSGGKDTRLECSGSVSYSKSGEKEHDEVVLSRNVRLDQLVKAFGGEVIAEGSQIRTRELPDPSECAQSYSSPSEVQAERQTPKEDSDTELGRAEHSPAAHEDHNEECAAKSDKEAVTATERCDSSPQVSKKLIKSNELRGEKYFRDPVQTSLPYVETRRTISIDAAYVNLFVDEECMLFELNERVGIQNHEFLGNVVVYSLS